MPRGKRNNKSPNQLPPAENPADRPETSEDLRTIYSGLSQRNSTQVRMFYNIKQIKQSYIEYLGNCKIFIHNPTTDAASWNDVFSMDVTNLNPVSDIFSVEQSNYTAYREKTKDVSIVYPPKEYFEAQEYVYDVLHKGTQQERIDGAKKALKISDLSVDARVVLSTAKNDDQLEEQLRILEEANKKGEEVLRGWKTEENQPEGKSFWDKNYGKFGNWIYAGPYLRSVYIKAKVLLRLAQKYPEHSKKRMQYSKQALETVDQLLELDSGDKYGARILKAKVLMDKQEHKECLKFLDKKFGLKNDSATDDLFLASLYTKVLAAFYVHGASSEVTTGLLNKALQRDPERFVPRLLIGEIMGREQSKLTIELGSKEEAAAYVYDFGRYWWSANGKLPWGFSTNPKDSGKTKEMPEINEEQPSAIDWICEKLKLQLQNENDPLGFWIARVSFNIGDHEHACTLFRSFVNKIFEKAEGNIDKIPTGELNMIFEALVGFFAVHEKLSRNRNPYPLPSSSDKKKEKEKATEPEQSDKPKNAADSIEWPAESIPGRLRLITNSFLPLFQVVTRTLENRTGAGKNGESMYSKQSVPLGWSLARWHWQTHNMERAFAQAKEIAKVAKGMSKESWMRSRAETMLRFVIQENLKQSKLKASA
ncbi:hypothetical protein K7432_009569 [Basidiobolus ranarum]|uniref:Uncharacterized protein n=1 Tax=Basidiobolus ranarum TaxID=34480 RepID=A0ABR2VWU0_9FUNG